MSDMDKVEKAFAAALDDLERGAPEDLEGSLARLRMRRDRSAQNHLSAPIEGARESARTIGWRLGSLGVVALIGLVWIGVSYRQKDVGVPDIKNYSTASGQIANIKLADGSHVTLAPATKLRIAGNTVDLEGEALFNVIHNDKAPFVVRTSYGNTRVLGTSFSVRSYLQDKSVRVIVESGRVVLGGAGVLGAGDLATVTETGQAIVSHNVNVASVLAWQSGTLTFKDARVSEVLDELSRWYPVSFTLSDTALSSQRITTQLSTKLPVDVVARDLAELLDVGVRRVGDRVELGGR